ncbi:MAG: 2-amino-4-hydroxy-6-hydroxymethyldihydropteridine diphosphokinase [Deltaproteobacteria bacterium]|nr:MAG: 2-amino-4-hydroxy-6-hydroxymethyldihydropteridine diphosphokinase [Deltaproteobacteria bacterium]
MAELTMPSTAWLSVGANLGDKVNNCLKGIAVVNASDGCKVLDVSRFYRTSPVDYLDQDWFVNAAVRIATRLAPLELLDLLLSIQRKTGRKKGGIRFGPRLLDLDILLFDNRTMRSPQLEIPHPRMHKRAFVLVPICDIDPTVTHPVYGDTVAHLLEGLEDDTQHVMPMETQPTLTRGRMP